MVISQAAEATITQVSGAATIFDGMSRRSPEGVNFKTRAEDAGWKQAVQERDLGSDDWTRNGPWGESG